MWCQTVWTIEAVGDEALAYKKALQHALTAVEEIQETHRISEDELSWYNRAGIPVLRLALDPDQLCRKMLSDLNYAFNLFSRPLVLVVSVSV